MQWKGPQHMSGSKQSDQLANRYDLSMANGTIVSTFLHEEKLVITLSDGSYILLTLDQLLHLGAPRHRLPTPGHDIVVAESH